jgi:hypothetical protein
MTVKRYKRDESCIEEEKFMGPTIGLNIFDKMKLIEAVQNPENYVKLIGNKITEFNLKNTFTSIDDLIVSLNSYFINEKIEFRLSKKPAMLGSGVDSGGFNPKTNEIYIFYNYDITDAFKIENKEYNKNNFEDFLEEFSTFLGHETIHRIQSFKDKIKKVGVMIDEDKKRYLAQPKEIMAYAWQIVQYIKMGTRKDNKFVRKMLTSIRDEDNLKFINYITPLSEYYNLFDKNSKTMKLLYKYIYLYIED